MHGIDDLILEKGADIAHMPDAPAAHQEVAGRRQPLVDRDLVREAWIAAGREAAQ